MYPSILFFLLWLRESLGPSPGSGLQAPHPGLGLGPGEFEARARPSRARARASRPSRARDITSLRQWLATILRRAH
ncbi:hypothetical protein B0H16DRAFT_1623338 [Mycena metata]|uniref:Uncharacterized protein n=1 Tax=Mycena metata TaxID=1033252 RepID=A0AAD7ME45_9AGAR|nr:hypothetical protein B0H16DRAFT_1623338 [Mycena metata]